MKHYVYLLPVNETPFSVFCDLAIYLNKNSSFLAVLLLDSVMEKHTSKLEKMGIEYITLYGGNSQEKEMICRKKTFKGTVKKYILEHHMFSCLLRFVRTTSAFMVFDFFLTIFQLKRNYKIALAVYQKKKPEALILYGDRHLGFEQALIRVFNEKNIPSIIIPVATSDPQASAYLRRNYREFYCSGARAPLLNKFAKWISPQWVYCDRERELLFYPSGKALAGYWLGMIPIKPWFNGGGYSTLVAVDSEETKERHVNYGIPRKKIIVTGHPSHDHLFKKYLDKKLLKEELYNKYGFNNSNKLIICAIPQMAEHGIISWNQHMEIIDFLINKMAQTGQNILLSLHPKSELKNYSFLEQLYSCKISKEKLNEILPSADIYVATFSSTVQWAALCRIPCIVVDFYGFDYSIYDNIGGVVKISLKELFSPALERLINDQDFFSQIKADMESYAKQTPFDGMSRKRIVQAINKLISTNN